MNRAHSIPPGKSQLPINTQLTYPTSDARPLEPEVIDHDIGVRQPPLAPYGSPSPSTHSLPQLHHPCPAPSQQSPASRHQSESFDYYGNTGTYASGPPSGSYHLPGTDHMAVAHAMRPQVPPNVYHTPQSNSPASVHSPQDHRNRPLFAPQQSNMYYPSYPQQTPYIGQHTMLQHPSLAPQPPPYPQTSYHQSPPLPQHMQPHPPPPLDQNLRSSHTQGHRSSSQLGSTHLATKSGPGPRPGNGPVQALSQSANPGPIPATTPLVSKTDNNGVQYITFEYSKDRVKVPYEIRCDVESVDLQSLSDSFKEQNCVYPRACSTKEAYRGNRLNYETQCNELGWALAHLNESLRGKRGLIQRAVDSWRNSNSDVRLRSRRVRRLYKNQKRSSNAAQQMNKAGIQQFANAPRTVPSVVQSQVQSLPSSESAHHHQMHGDHSLHNRANAGLLHHQVPPLDTKGPSQSTDMRHHHVENFYPTYPMDPPVGSNQLPPTYDAFSPIGARSSASAATASAPKMEADAVATQAAGSHLPSLRQPKNFTIQDRQNGVGVKVKFDVESVNLGDIPPPFRLINSVYPRSHFARQQTDSPPPDEDTADDTASLPLGRTLVPVRLDDGWETDVAIPRMSRSRRGKERVLNECGNRVTWTQTQSFNRRPLLLAQALNLYRGEVRKRLSKDGHPIPSHFLTRTGKSRWERASVRQD